MMRRNFICLCLSVVLMSFHAQQAAAAPQRMPAGYKYLRAAHESFQQSNFDSAEENCRKAVKINPRLFPAYNLLGAIYSAKTGEEEKAIEYFRISLDVAKKQPQLYNQIAALYNRMNMLPEAVTVLEEGLKFSPRDFGLNYNLGLLYLIDKHDADGAVEFFTKALKEQPDNERLLYMTGFAHVLAGEKAEALSYITRLRSINNEYLAVKLEDSMREREMGKGIDVGGAMEDYSKEPAPAEAPLSEDAADNVTMVGTPSSVLTAKPSSTAGGAGKVTIKQTYRKAEPGDAPGDEPSGN